MSYLRHSFDETAFLHRACALCYDVSLLQSLTWKKLTNDFWKRHFYDDLRFIQDNLR